MHPHGYPAVSQPELLVSDKMDYSEPTMYITLQYNGISIKIQQVSNKTNKQSNLMFIIIGTMHKNITSMDSVALTKIMIYFKKNTPVYN